MKLWNYIVTITGISILMAIAGLEVAGFTDLFKTIGLTINSSGIGNLDIQSTLWNKVFGTTGLLVSVISTTAVGIGTFLYTKDKSFLMIPLITGVTFYWVSVLVSIINYSREYPIFGTIIILVLIPLTIGFIQSAVDFFLGND